MGEAAYAELVRLCEERVAAGNQPAPHPATTAAATPQRTRRSS